MTIILVMLSLSIVFELKSHRNTGVMAGKTTPGQAAGQKRVDVVKCLQKPEHPTLTGGPSRKGGPSLNPSFANRIAKRQILASFLV